MQDSNRTSADDKIKEVGKTNPRMTFDDVKVGETYLIPRIGKKSRKKVRITEKSDFSIKFKEIDDNGKEAIWTSTLYSTEIEIAFFVKEREF